MIFRRELKARIKRRRPPEAINPNQKQNPIQTEVGNNVLVSDLPVIVKKEAFYWGDNVAEAYFEAAVRDVDRQWARVDPFLSQFPINYSSTMDLACGRGRNSENLAVRAKNMTLVDVNPQNITFCKQKFSSRDWRFIINNGFDLRSITDESITFIYCIEAAVHFDLEIILSYIKEFRRVLAPGGCGFVHHSNVTKDPGIHFRENWHNRNFMSKEIFAHLCIHNGLEILGQRVEDWGFPEMFPKTDCFSLFQKARNTVGYAADPPIV